MTVYRHAITGALVDRGLRDEQRATGRHGGANLSSRSNRWQSDHCVLGKHSPCTNDPAVLDPILASLTSPKSDTHHIPLFVQIISLLDIWCERLGLKDEDGMTLVDRVGRSVGWSQQRLALSSQIDPLYNPNAPYEHAR